MSFMDFFSKFTGGFGGASSVDLAIDLGTANTLVAITGEGVVLNEPSVVAIERSTHRVLAVGHEAKQMINHTPDAFSAEHPLRDGVIADYDVTEAMLSAFINKAIERRYPWQAKPRIVICIPCGATSVEKRAVFEAAIQSGARQAYLIEEPMAAAMGADLPVTEPTGSMVVDIGGGTTEVAVISLGGIVTSSSLRLAGNKMDEAIAMYLRDLLGIKVGELTQDVTAAQSQATEDPQGALASLTETVNQMRPLYEELANLPAPEAFAEAQAKIKEGSEASIEILDLTLEMMELASNPDTMEEAQEKMTELTEKMNSYSDQASKLTEGLTEVLGS